ncbi:hypothetical protein B0H13DRAFT_2300118 [Mycena leptocephala]|nr:hypothetical protein B0H13DRAFT_2300118 [Mycena leptocephala]
MPVLLFELWDRVNAAAREFLANVGLSGILPSDKRFEGKTEWGLQQEVHSLAQVTAGLASGVTESRIETVEVVSDIEARVTAVDNRTKAATTAQHEVAHLHERVDHVGVALTRLEAQVDTAFHAVNSLVARLDTITAPPAPIAAPVSLQPPTTHVAAVPSAPLAAVPPPPSAAPATTVAVALTAPSLLRIQWKASSSASTAKWGTVLPSANWIMRSFRARRGADQYTVIACFELAEIAARFTPAFNAAPAGNEAIDLWNLQSYLKRGNEHKLPPRLIFQSASEFAAADAMFKGDNIRQN